MATTTKRTIKVKNHSDVNLEAPASGVIIPGMLLEYTSTGAVKAHATAAGKHAFMFAFEDELQGKGINDDFADGDKVQVWVAGRGDIVYALLEDEANIAIGDFLESNGAGLLQEYTSGVIVGVAVEAQDLSSLPEGSESSAGGIYYRPRVMCQIV